MMQFDGTLEALINSELAAALLISRQDHFLIVLEADECCVSCTNTSWCLKRPALGRGGHFVLLLHPGAS